MIVVEVKLVSARGPEFNQLLGSAIISNVGATPDGKYGDYDVAVARKTDAADLCKVYNSPLRRGKVLRHPRLAQNMWRLVLKAIASAFPEEKVTLPDDDAPDQDPEYTEVCCIACEDKPVAPNDPCAVCGKSRHGHT